MEKIPTKDRSRVSTLTVPSVGTAAPSSDGTVLPDGQHPGVPIAVPNTLVTKISLFLHMADFPKAAAILIATTGTLKPLILLAMMQDMPDSVLLPNRPRLLLTELKFASWDGLTKVDKRRILLDTGDMMAAEPQGLGMMSTTLTAMPMKPTLEPIVARKTNHRTLLLSLFTRPCTSLTSGIPLIRLLLNAQLTAMNTAFVREDSLRNSQPRASTSTGTITLPWKICATSVGLGNRLDPLK